MSQIIHYWCDGIENSRTLPDPNSFVLSGVKWGSYTTIFTPAYWLSQFWMNGYEQKSIIKSIRSGDIFDETVFCLLGGYGISAEMATAAFITCKQANLISSREESEHAWKDELNKKICINGKLVSYRFPNQKAKYISHAMKRLKTLDNQISGKKLRDELLRINGIGPKTAGWIVRNCFDADDVAIIDIHIQRAGLLCGIFKPTWTVDRHYSKMEKSFLDFCEHLEVRASSFDYLIWDQMRKLGALAINSVKYFMNNAINVPTQVDA